eukprot:CAMPEP_0118938770 /NCGR_PEP_ID=MMETSP1169-20130426/27012_1 /TAXON_ID=36882 /ORGANISM="Pyramimonas obovata, Strain CCMP722" /LENGTH=199 /DNA_ID=CAMNT_0006882827 /DNA_START=148 /DNA_END=744 /DNA_ORIENTATION=-
MENLESLLDDDDAPLDQEALNQEAASMRNMIFGSAPTSTPQSVQQPHTSGAPVTGGMSVPPAGTAQDAQSRPGILQGVPATGLPSSTAAGASTAPANRPQVPGAPNANPYNKGTLNIQKLLQSLAPTCTAAQKQQLTEAIRLHKAQGVANASRSQLVSAIQRIVGRDQLVSVIRGLVPQNVLTNIQQQAQQQQQQQQQQ